VTFIFERRRRRARHDCARMVRLEKADGD